MNSRLQEILKLLIRKSDSITSQQLAILLNVTSRTIRNDMKLLESIIVHSGAKIESSRGSHGYQLEVINKDKFNVFLKNILNDGESSLPVEPEDRIKFLLKRILLSSDFVKIEDLADEVYVSRSTIQNDLKDVKVILKKYHLKLSARPNYGLKVSGEEKHIRYCISEEVFGRNTLIKYSENNTQSWLLPINEMDFIKEIILANLRRFQLNLSDIALNNLVVHISIACKRVQLNKYVNTYQREEEEISNKKEYKVATTIVKEIEKKLDIKFPKVEVLYVTMHLLGTKLFLVEEQKNFSKNLDPSIMDTVIALLHEVEGKMQLGLLEDKELFAGIAIHLKPAIHRYKHGMNIRNPILEAIKENYPLAFEAGIIAGKVIEEKQHITIDENEIGYIALHFGAAIERSKLKTKPKRCLIVCTTGVGSSQLLLYKLRSKFGTKVNFLGTTELHSIDKYKESEIDLIISTVNLPPTITVPHVVVSAFLNDEDVNVIDEHINEQIQDVVERYLSPELIFKGMDLKSSREVIDYFGEQLMARNIVKGTFVESVLRREQASSTSYGNLVAIPHPLVPQSSKTFWSLCILQEPIQWGNQKVQLVFLLHVAEKNKEELEPMYKRLIQLVDNKNILQKLLSCKTNKAIINTLKKM